MMNDKSFISKSDAHFLCLLIEQVSVRGALKPIEFGDIHSVYMKLLAVANADDTEEQEETEPQQQQLDI